MSTLSKQRLATTSPSFWACVLGVLIGLILVVIGVYVYATTDMPAPLSVAFVLIGLTEIATGYHAWKLNRVAWAFALSVNGTVGTVFVFTAPRLRDALDVPIAVALLPALLFGSLVLLHSLKPEDF